MDSTLREKILDEQDQIIYFSYNYLDEGEITLPISAELDFIYRKFNDEFLGENLDIIPELRTKNLMYLLQSSSSQVREIAKNTIMSRIKENGEHFCCGENVRYDSMSGVTVNLWLKAFSSLTREEQYIVKQVTYNDYKALEKNSPAIFEIIKQAEYVLSMDNFFSVYEEGIFTPEKIEFLGRLFQENPNILDSINYRIFDDSIFEMGEEFVSRIARYPNISNKLIIISQNNPALLETIKQGFSQLEQNKTRLPEVLEIQDRVISYAAKNCVQISDINFEDLVNCAFRDGYFYDKRTHVNCQDYEKDFEKKCDIEYDKLSSTSKHSGGNSYINRGKKDILLMKYFGMNRKEAELFCIRYKADLDSIQISDQEAKRIY